ncbi:tetratricopeptide repeat protein [Candidatus Azambacteria bacterium]|nr:tetratricopeptide repeat protein [Candidatus Azambacteria bacterium]
MNKKKIIISILILLVLALAGGGFYFFKKPKNNNEKNISQLEELRKEKPDLAPYIDEVEKGLNGLNKNDLQTYSILGLGWKSFADQTKNPEDYKKALAIYEEAIELSKRKNTLFILNAGNMDVYIGDYKKAESYFEEATAMAPGDIDGYQRLINLHMYQLKSDKDTITAIFDRGIKRMVDPAPLTKWKEAYLRNLEENAKSKESN